MLFNVVQGGYLNNLIKHCFRTENYIIGADVAGILVHIFS